MFYLSSGLSLYVGAWLWLCELAWSYWKEPCSIVYHFLGQVWHNAWQLFEEVEGGGKPERSVPCLVLVIMALLPLRAVLMTRPVLSDMLSMLADAASAVWCC